MKGAIHIATMLAALALGGSSAQAPAPPSVAEEASLHGYGDADKTCLEWNDGCRTCRRPEGGETVCSNIGIACQPAALTCTRRTETPKTEPPK